MHNIEPALFFELRTPSNVDTIHIIHMFYQLNYFLTGPTNMAGNMTKTSPLVHQLSQFHNDSRNAITNCLKNAHAGFTA